MKQRQVLPLNLAFYLSSKHVSRRDKLTHHSFPLIHKNIRKSPFHIQRAAHCVPIGRERQHPLLPSTNHLNEGRGQWEKQRLFIYQPISGKLKGHPPISGVGWIGVLCCWFSEALEGGVRVHKRSWFGRIYCWVHGWVELISGAVFKLLNVISFWRGLVLQWLDWACGKP